ncbi:PREDICTED: CD209 antigen-like [Branchiostoma belcheri]|uniref:CD209 antigen-like n=1 Tax=Branchiostoma belcheri TaxID=7741 RepID=A0A6P4YQ02_BRABE|nr:PREDICTED: CD209 antigen-like [Branchiostoma belcheri]
MYEQAEPVRLPFSGPDSPQPSEPPPQPRPVRQSGSRGRVRHGNGASDKQREDQDTSSHTYENAEEAKRYATSADGAYPGGASGRRGVCSFLLARRSFLAAGIAVLLSLCAMGLAPLTFSNKQEISQLSTTVDALKRDQDGITTTVDALKRDQDGITTTVDALKRDQDGITTTVDALKRDQDGITTTVDALKRDLDNERSRTAALEQRLNKIEKTLLTSCTCPEGYTIWRGIGYKAFNTRKTFREAAAACRQDGGTLAMPRDADTNAFLIFLKNSVTDYKDFWIGLHDQREEGKFEWVDGSALGSYSSWGRGEPNDEWHDDDEDCVNYSAGKKDKWNDAPCHFQLYFMCQVAPGRA